MQKFLSVFCFSLARTFLFSVVLVFEYSDPFLDFFFPFSVFESPFSFVIRDPQQFTAARV